MLGRKLRPPIEKVKKKYAKDQEKVFRDVELEIDIEGYSRERLLVDIRVMQYILFTKLKTQ